MNDPRLGPMLGQKLVTISYEDQRLALLDQELPHLLEDHDESHVFVRHLVVQPLEHLARQAFSLHV